MNQELKKRVGKHRGRFFMEATIKSSSMDTSNQTILGQNK